MVSVDNIKTILIVGMLLVFSMVYGQSEVSDTTNVELPKPLKSAYKSRTMVIKKDTVTYRHRWIIPGQYKVQYAGSIGFMSIGFGYAITPTYQPALYFGYLSEAFGGSKNTVVTISLKNSFYLIKEPLFNYFNPYVGFSINWGNTQNTFKKLPDYYPDKYYFQNKIHLAPFVGGEIKFDLNNRYFNGFGVYTEFSALDAYLLEAIRTKYVKPYMALSVAFGVTFYLR